MTSQPHKSKLHFDHLPVRPEPLFGESLPGYLWRCLSLNGHEYRDSLFSSAMAGRDQDKWLTLTQFFGVGRLTPLLDAHSEQIALLKRFDFTDRQVAGHTCQPCPACIRSTGAFMAWQLLPFVSVCVEHGCWLMHSCSTCGHSLSWSRIKPNWTCRCGATLGNQMTRQAPAWAVRLALWVMWGSSPWLSGRREGVPYSEFLAPSRPPSFFTTPTRGFRAAMSSMLIRARTLSEHGTSETSSPSSGVMLGQDVQDIKRHPLTPEEKEVVHFVLDDGSMSPRPWGCRMPMDVRILALMPVRPRPRVGESTRGYLMRVACANGHSTTRIWQDSREDASVGLFWGLLAGHLALASRDISKLMGPPPSVYKASELLPLPLGLAPSDFNHAHRRWCPLCLARDPVLQGIWEIKLVCVCPIHSVWLVEQCPRCGVRQRWVGTDVTRCACGAKLADAPAVRASRVDQQMATRLSHSYGDDSLHAGFEKLTVPLRHRFVRYMGLIGAGAMPSKPGQQAHLHCLNVARRTVVGATRLLSTWPTFFEEQLVQVPKSTDRHLSLKETYGLPYRVVYRDLRDPGFQFVRDAFEDHMRAHWPGLVCRRNTLLKPSTLEQHPRRTLRETAQAARIGTSAVRHLVQAQLIPANSVTLQSGRRMTTIHEDAVAPLIDLVQGGKTLKDAARHAALPKRRIRQMIRAGLLQPLISPSVQHAAASLIAKVDLDRLILDGVGASAGPTITVLGALKYWRLEESEAMAMLTAVLDGSLPVQKGPPSGVPIGLADVSRKELRDWLSAFRSIAKSAMSIDDASILLGVKQQVAYGLVRRGLLMTSGGDSKVRPSDVVEFTRQFVSLISLARAAKRSPRALLNELQARPVTGPCIDGTRQYFYLRSEVETQQPRATPPASQNNYPGASNEHRAR